MLILTKTMPKPSQLYCRKFPIRQITYKFLHCIKHTLNSRYL